MAGVAIITGAASGIGRHFAETLLAKGYQLVLGDVNAEALQATFPITGKPLLSSFLDVADPGSWEELVAATLDRFSRIDYLFNIAGVIRPGYVHEIDPADIDYHFEVNTKGLMIGTRLVAPVMIKQGNGHIINIASLAGVAPVAGIGLYSASKFAARAYSIAAAYELRPKGVYVSVLCPDLVDTPMLTKQLDYEAAAMTFSGSHPPLSVQEIERALFRIMETRPVEMTIPAGRSRLAKLGNLLPGLGLRLTKRLQQKGLDRLYQLKSRRKK